MSAAPSAMPITEVAAAVLLSRDGREFMLACRPEGKVYAGYWEFPGGKVEPGEDVRQALVRELKEELGITVTHASPWLRRHFRYPHAHVCLNFWRVTAWDGEIGITAPLEHSAIAWQPLTGPVTVAPLLPANAPILKALSLPCCMAITQAEQLGVSAELLRLERALARGIRLIQLRDRGLAPDARLDFGTRLMQLARTVGALVLVSEDADLARRIGAHGLHLSAAGLARSTTRPDFAWVGASCHDAAELAQASRLALDYALLGPVLPTLSHPEAAPLGWPAFARLARDCPLPVFALGGQSEATLSTAQQHGAHGIAMLRAW